jgi:hypothetical protein
MRKKLIKAISSAGRAWYFMGTAWSFFLAAAAGFEKQTKL